MAERHPCPSPVLRELSEGYHSGTLHYATLGWLQQYGGPVALIFGNGNKKHVPVAVIAPPGTQVRPFDADSQSANRWQIQTNPLSSENRETELTNQKALSEALPGLLTEWSMNCDRRP